MSKSDYGRRLLWHGIFLFLLGLVVGFTVSVVKNPRMGLSAHLEGVMNGIFLAVLGLAWEKVNLSERTCGILFWLALYGTYVNWATTFFAALFGTSRSTPIAGAGFAGQAWQENLVTIGLMSLAVAIVTTCELVLWGLRRRQEVSEQGTKNVVK